MTLIFVTLSSKMKINAHAQKFYFRFASKTLTFSHSLSMDFAIRRKLLKLLFFVCKNLIKNCCIFLNNTKRMFNYMKNLYINVNLTQNVKFIIICKKIKDFPIFVDVTVTSSCDDTKRKNFLNTTFSESISTFALLPEP